MIRLENVYKSFGEHEVLKGVTLHVKEGEKLVIIGPSGSGKSTMIRCMNYIHRIAADIPQYSTDTSQSSYYND